MSNNFGIDLFVQDKDIMIGINGDYLTTQDVEQVINELPFEGYVALRETIAKVLYPEQGTFSPFNYTDGAGAVDLISSTSDFEDKFTNFKNRVVSQLSKDDRVESVEEIDYNIYSESDKNIITIIVKVIPNNLQKVSTFVFPFFQT